MAVPKVDGQKTGVSALPHEDHSLHEENVHLDELLLPLLRPFAEKQVSTEKFLLETAVWMKTSG
jgi:hypothetical protein